MYKAKDIIVRVKKTIKIEPYHLKNKFQPYLKHIWPNQLSLPYSNLKQVWKEWGLFQALFQP